MGVRTGKGRDSGIAVFRVASERWINETNQKDLPQLIRESLDEF
jgi:hypothetical protein